MEIPRYLAPFGVASLIIIVAYGCQILFHYIAPGPLTWRESVELNALVAATWICLARSCLLDPGRVPIGWKPCRPSSESVDQSAEIVRSRWCVRCEAPKPPRAHHCKTCQRCIPKMDHHCPWTANCVSHRTMPHFMRLLLYATASMIDIEYLLYVRAKVVWDKRSLPSYLGPSPPQLAALLVIILANSMVCFAVGVLLLRSLWQLAMNVTTIESWEIERHQVLLRRARALGGYLDGPDGTRIRITKQEFPYDIGVWSNINQGMACNILMWLNPLGGSPGLHEGMDFPVNEFEDATTSWPPPDPDRMVRRSPPKSSAFTHSTDETDAERITSFRSRQAADRSRFQNPSHPQRRRPFHKRYDSTGSELPNEMHRQDEEAKKDEEEGEESWRSSEGERLRDFGLDEDAEFYDEDDVPLAQLLKARATP